MVTGDARSAFQPLRDNGGLSPFVPRPGPLQRDLHAQRSEVRYNQRSQTSWTSSCTKQNAISSSYSSTGGFPWLKQTRMGEPALSHCQLTLSSSKTVSEARPQAVPSGHTQCEKAADTTPGQTLTPRTGSPRSQASKSGRRKFPLLPRRRGEPLMLPPPLELGIRVTAEDLDLEKEAAFQCINSVLRGEAKAIWDCRPSQPSHTLSSLATGTCGLFAVSKAPRMDAQQERDKSQDSRGPVAPLASAAEAPSTAPVSGKKHRPSGPLFSFSDPLPATSSHSQDSAQVTSLIPAPLPAASMDGGMRRARPGTSAPAAAAAAPPPSTLTPTSGSLLSGLDGGPSHFRASTTAAAGAQRSEVRYNQRSQTSCMSSCLKRHAISSSYSSMEGFPWLKRRRMGEPASSHCQLTLSSSKTVSEGRPQAASSGHTQCKKVADTAPGQTFAPRTGSHRSQASRPRKCKFPLLPRRRRAPGPLFFFSHPLPATSSHSQDSAQVTSLIPAPLPAASMDGGMRRARPGTSAPAAAAAAPPPSTLTPTSGSLLSGLDGGPSHFRASTTAAAGAQRSEVRYNQRSQTSWTSSCLKRHAISSSYSSMEGFPWPKRRRMGEPASSHCQLTLSSSKTVSEGRPQAASSGHTQCKKVADTAPGQTFAPRTGSPRSQASRPRLSPDHLADSCPLASCKHGWGHEKSKAWHFCSCSCCSGPSPLHFDPHVRVPTEWTGWRPFTFPGLNHSCSRCPEVRSQI
ncbi:putative POM121-like protein 1-like [Chlorocebus sabaeus]|uniref:putative POM121-like protein 1-like n=1 Tax=Chlorocebus sabaeus TaxID=60711 RepID=UPI003BF9D883